MNKHPSSEQLHEAALEHPVVGEVASKKPVKAKAKPTKRTCIMVLGMHRSGTSALTRAISMLGAELPNDSMPADRNNVNGYWEPTRLALLNDQMITESGSRWDDWRPFDFGNLPASRVHFFKTEIARIIGEEYGDDALIVLKEPRICRLVPLYEEILGALNFQMRYILTVRNPLAVTASLNKRDGITFAFGSLLWLRHVLEAEAATRGASRVFLSYESLVGDWYPSIARIGETLSINWPRPQAEAKVEIDRFLSSEHQHHVATVEHLLADETVTQWIKDTYLAVLSFEKDPHDAAALARLDKIKAAFDAGTRQFGAVSILELNAKQAIFNEAISASELRNAQKDGEIKLLADDAAGLRTQTEGLIQRESAQKQLLAEKDQEISKLAEGGKNHLAQLETMRHQLVEAERRLLESKDRLVESEGRLVESKDRLLESEGRLVESKDRLLESKDRLLESERRFTELERRFTELEHTFTELQRSTASERDGLLHRQTQLVTERDDKARQAEILLADINTIYRSRTWRASRYLSRVVSYFRWWSR